MAEIIVFSQEYCPNCEEMKEYLNERGIQYKEKNLQDPDVFASLLLDGCTSFQEAPIIKIDGTYHSMTSAQKFLA